MSDSPDICFTSAARLQLLEAVRALRDRDRARARGLVDSVEERLRAVASYTATIREMELESGRSDNDSHYRLIYRHRNDTVWVVAVLEPDT